MKGIADSKSIIVVNQSEEHRKAQSKSKERLKLQKLDERKQFLQQKAELKKILKENEALRHGEIEKIKSKKSAQTEHQVIQIKGQFQKLKQQQLEKRKELFKLSEQEKSKIRASEQYFKSGSSQSSILTPSQQDIERLEQRFRVQLAFQAPQVDKRNHILYNSIKPGYHNNDLKVLKEHQDKFYKTSTDTTSSSMILSLSSTADFSLGGSSVPGPGEYNIQSFLPEPHEWNPQKQRKGTQQKIYMYGMTSRFYDPIFEEKWKLLHPEWFDQRLEGFMKKEKHYKQEMEQQTGQQKNQHQEQQRVVVDKNGNEKRPLSAPMIRKKSQYVPLIYRTPHDQMMHQQFIDNEQRKKKQLKVTYPKKDLKWNDSPQFRFSRFWQNGPEETLQPEQIAELTQEEKQEIAQRNETSKYLNTRNDIDPAIKEEYLKPGVGRYLTKDEELYLQEYENNQRLQAMGKAPVFLLKGGPRRGITTMGRFGQKQPIDYSKLRSKSVEELNDDEKFYLQRELYLDTRGEVDFLLREKTRVPEAGRYLTPQQQKQHDEWQANQKRQAKGIKPEYNLKQDIAGWSTANKQTFGRFGQQQPIDFSNARSKSADALTEAEKDYLKREKYLDTRGEVDFLLRQKVQIPEAGKYLTLQEQKDQEEWKMNQKRIEKGEKPVYKLKQDIAGWSTANKFSIGGFGQKDPNRIEEVDQEDEKAIQQQQYLDTRGGVDFLLREKVRVPQPGKYLSPKQMEIEREYQDNLIRKQKGLKPIYKLKEI